MPISPTVNSSDENRPASGRSASATSRLVLNWVTPCTCSVSAVVRMMKNIAMLEKNVPAPTSSLRRLISSAVAPRRATSECRPSAFSSSTSCDACQKKR